jgi:hypothetical protein
VPLVLVKQRKPSGRRAARWLDLDDVGAEVAKDLAAEQTSLGRQVKDTVGTKHRLPPSQEREKGEMGKRRNGKEKSYLPLFFFLCLA